MSHVDNIAEDRALPSPRAPHPTQEINMVI